MPSARRLQTTESLLRPKRRPISRSATLPSRPSIAGAQCTRMGGREEAWDLAAPPLLGDHGGRHAEKSRDLGIGFRTEERDPLRRPLLGLLPSPKARDAKRGRLASTNLLLHPSS